MEFIGLSKLRVAASNTRKTNVGDGVKELAASILAHGLLHNLVVVQNGVYYDVIDGQRRLLALRSLKLDGATPIPCEVRKAPAAVAEELSLAANVEREPLHPMDEYEAFARLAAAGQSVADIAARFGVETRTVERRMKLGELCPMAREAYRAGALDAVAIKALTLVKNHKQQEKILRACGSRKQGYAGWRISRLAKEDKIRTGTQLFDIADYEAAGGTVSVDLFSDDGDELSYFDDAVLYDKLQREAVERRLAAFREAGWGEAVFHERFSEFTPEARQYPPVHGRLGVKARANACMMLYFDGAGNLIERPCQTPAQAAAAAKAAKAAKAAAKAAGAEADDADGAAEADDAGSSYPRALVADLARQKSQLLQQHVIGSVAWSLRLLLFKLVAADAPEVEYAPHWSVASAGPDPAMRYSAGLWDEMLTVAKWLNCPLAPDAVINDEETRRRVHRWLFWRTGSGQAAADARKWEGIVAMGDERLQRSLALLGVLSVGVSPTLSEGLAANGAAVALNLQIEKVWTPKAEFFARLSKKQIVAIADEIGARNHGLAGKKKEAAVATMTRIFREPHEWAPTNEDFLRNVRTWLPPGMGYNTRVERRDADDIDVFDDADDDGAEIEGSGADS
jgi:ParB/RepB/Spo0J family partition protein